MIQKSRLMIDFSITLYSFNILFSILYLKELPSLMFVALNMICAAITTKLSLEFATRKELAPIPLASNSQREENLEMDSFIP